VEDKVYLRRDVYDPYGKNFLTLKNATTTVGNANICISRKIPPNVHTEQLNKCERRCKKRAAVRAFLITHKGGGQKQHVSFYK
jgi:hypothetical protein